MSAIAPFNAIFVTLLLNSLEKLKRKLSIGFAKQKLPGLFRSLSSWPRLLKRWIGLSTG